MSANPESLKNLCLDYLCDNIEHVKSSMGIGVTDPLSKDVASNYHFLPSEVSELLLIKLSERLRLNDESMTLFSNENVYLRFVFIYGSTMFMKN